MEYIEYRRAMIDINLNRFALAARTLHNHHSYVTPHENRGLVPWAIVVMFDALDNIESATDLADNWQWE